MYAPYYIIFSLAKSSFIIVENTIVQRTSRMIRLWSRFLGAGQQISKGVKPLRLLVLDVDVFAEAIYHPKQKGR